MPNCYRQPGPTRDEINSSGGAILLEFGTDWCGYCQAAAPLIAEALADFPIVEHVKVEDGPGRRLGRSFGIKLWPTAILLKDGIELSRVVRPQTVDDIRSRLRQLNLL